MDAAAADRLALASVSGKSLRFWPLLLVVLVADCASKRVIEARLEPGAPPRPVAGDVVRVTRGYNQNAAFGIPLGSGRRWVLISLVTVALAALAVIYRRAPARSTVLVTGLALVSGGALGNLLDRLRSTRGVLDWIDIGIGHARFWTFNVADLAITIGALCLIFSMARSSEHSS